MMLCVGVYSLNVLHSYMFFFFFNDTATTEIYTLSLHDALPISSMPSIRRVSKKSSWVSFIPALRSESADRKSTRLNSSHLVISYAVFCLKKKNYLLFFSVQWDTLLFIYYSNAHSLSDHSSMFSL